MNNSNFTYREQPLRPDSRLQPFLSELPYNQQPFTQAQINPQSALPRTANGQIIPPVATGSRILPSQVYVQPAQNIIVRDVRPVIASRVIEQRASSIPVSSIVQPLAIPQVSQVSQSISRETKNLQPTYEYDTKYEYHDEPQVETVRGSAWEGYYNQSKTIPPPPVSSIEKEKTSCSPVLLGILGLLALAGLITGIVLAAKASGGVGGGESGQSGTPGTPNSGIEYSNSTIIIETTIVNSTSASSTNSSNSNSTSNNQTVSPTPVQPVITSPVITNTTISPTVSNPVYDPIVTQPTQTSPTTTTTTTTTPSATNTTPSSGSNVADLYSYDPNSYNNEASSSKPTESSTINQRHKLRRFSE